jgi:DNA-directed RNA polymerase subunit RPC12/RpoP
MKLSLKDAVRQWVGEFNAIPQALIEKAYEYAWELEITPAEKKYVCDNCSEEFDRDYFENHAEENEYGDKLCPSCDEVDDDGERLVDAYIVEEEESEYREYGLPMWGTMWTFGSSFDEEWAKNNLYEMYECGFRIYESDELGVFFGIDGAGYDFYESHWTPLYKARGLKWHSEGETE